MSKRQTIKAFRGGGAGLWYSTGEDHAANFGTDDVREFVCEISDDLVLTLTSDEAEDNMSGSTGMDGEVEALEEAANEAGAFVVEILDWEFGETCYVDIGLWFEEV